MKSPNQLIGFMQGRLSEIVDGKIQSFPWANWKNEFSIAATINLKIIEWTLDQNKLNENPLMTSEGQNIIKNLCNLYQIKIPSVTGDCFMQSPFWKITGDKCEKLKKDFLAICCACANIGIDIIVVPLVDNGRINSLKEEDALIKFLLDNEQFFFKNNLKIIFESDYEPNELFRLMTRLPDQTFGINYDIGNSAALGYSPVEEFDAYGSRVLNIHVKDRLLGGGSVPLNTGNADFETAFNVFSKYKYKGNFILQTARSLDGNHTAILSKYREITFDLIEKYNLTD